MRCSLAALCGVISFVFSFAAQADSITFIEDNDWFNPTGHDYDYTQGTLIGYNFRDFSKDSYWQKGFDFFSAYTPFFEGHNAKRQVEWLVLGQNIYTPINNHSPIPPANDRPYAGWLYTGAALMEDHGGKSLDYVELLVGVVGPASLAENTQNIFHNMVGTNKRQGWDYQLDNEPGVALSLEKKWRFHQPIEALDGLGIEMIPEGGVTLGNIWTQAQTGIQFRFGQYLLANYGAQRIRPALSGTSYYDADAIEGSFAWNLYASLQGRAVARNIFLDGNTFSDSPSVDKKSLVGNAQAGISILMKDGPKMDFAYVWCSEEADISRGCSHYAGATVGWNF